jgi:uncharacterized surface protein with fasciclin (FAS1) repeats
MLNGEMVTVNEVTVTTAGGTTATVTVVDVKGDNGVVHIDDDVLVLSSIDSTVIDFGAFFVHYNCGIGATLKTLGPLTLFAPNTAFEALSNNTVDLLKFDEGAVTLASILHYHVVRDL